ncbi:hypothetical protein V8B97DRAFT_1980295 [Scleroderma yunnanense]
MWFLGLFTIAFSLVGLANAHLTAWHKSMYCLNGTTPGQVNYNTDDAVQPLWMLSKNDYWFHHINGCDEFPPAEGDFLELPAGRSFTVEIATNRAFTSLSYNGEFSTEWLDGQNHTGSVETLLDAALSPEGCITDPNIHTQNETMASGTAFAIAYKSDIKDVTLEDLVVFTVRYNTPWKRVTTYDVPAQMPACPDGGCMCAWVWIPNGCGEPNIYMEGYKCMVTNATSTTSLATPQAPVWCEDDQTKCVQGAKQIMIWNQLEGNNINVTGLDLSGNPKSPTYNAKCGFKDGAQDDIFGTSNSPSTQTTSAAPSTPPTITSNTTPTTSGTTSSTSSTAPASSNSETPVSGTSLEPSPSSSPCTSSTPYVFAPSTPTTTNTPVFPLPSTSPIPSSNPSTDPGDPGTNPYTRLHHTESQTTPTVAYALNIPLSSPASKSCKRRRMVHKRRAFAF